MSTNRQPVNPLFNPPAPTRQTTHRAVKFGGYGGMALVAWLFTAVATGYGCAAADTTGSASESSASSSASTPSGTADESQPAGSTAGSSGTGSTTGTAESATAATESTAGSESTGTTSSTEHVAPGVTVSSSGGAHTSASGSGSANGAPAEEPPATESTPPSESAEATGTPSASPEPAVEQLHPTVAEANSSHSTAAASTPAPSVPATKVDAVGVAAAATDTSSSTGAAAANADAPQAFSATAARSISTQSVPTVAAAAVSPTQAVSPAVGVVGFLNAVVTNLLNPFLAPAPNTPDPLTPVVWAVLAYVRRNFFNEAPTVSYNPATTVQTGQTVTGYIGASDAEGDTLTYTVTRDPQHGTVTIDQTTGKFTYTPDDIDYDAAQVDSFTVSVTDGKTNLLSLLGVSHGVDATTEVTVLNPGVERVILTMPAGITKPVNPRYADGGQAIVFAGTPTAGGRQEIYQIDIDGTDAVCLTCGLAAPAVAGTNPALPINIQKPVPFYDGSGRIVVLLNNPDPRYAIFEPAGYNGVGSPARIVNVDTPDGGGATLPGLPPGGILNRQREMRPSPDGTHVLFTRIVFGQTGNFQAVPIVGALTANGDHYEVTDARVVWPTGESKQWTPDGKGVIIQGGAIDAGNVDDIMVDLSGQTGDYLYPGSTFRGTRVTGNLDYDEDIDMSPNMQWITVGSTRGFDALTPMTRIVRQNFLPFYVGAAIYDQYADGQVRNVSNQNWAVAIEDDLKRENGIPLFVQDDPTTPGIDEGDGWISRSMPSWNPDGTAVTFWESGNGDEHGIAPTESRLVIANLKYTTSVGPVGDTTTTVDLSAFPALSTYVAKTTPLPPTGSYNGFGGGTAVVNDVVDATTRQTTRTVVYTDYVNEDGLILNGIEKGIYGPSQLSVTYLADIDVTDATGATRGSLDANALFTLLPTQSVTGFITSTLDGDTQTIPDPAKVEDAKTGA
jgi:hypothetical protein